MVHTTLVNTTAIYAFTAQGVRLAADLVQLLCKEESKADENVTSYSTLCSSTNAGAHEKRDSHENLDWHKKRGSHGNVDWHKERGSYEKVDSHVKKGSYKGGGSLMCSSDGIPFSCSPLAVFVPERLEVTEHIALHRFSSLSALLEKQFTAYKHHIFIGAMGIVVRSIAPYIKSKTSDPAVIVIDQKAQFVISVLSGHIGNANEVTEYIAKKLDATPIITTATDVEGLPAIDSLATKRGLRIDNMEAAKYISAALLAAKPVELYDPQNWLQVKDSPHKKYFVDISQSTSDVLLLGKEDTPSVIVTEKKREKSSSTLVLAPPLFCAGIGCKRGTSADTIITQLTYAFEHNGLSLFSLHSLASVDIKKEEKGLLEVAEQLGVALMFFSREELDAYPTKNISKKCLATFGIKGVCESAALAAAGKNAQLEQEKIADNGVTIAIARRAKTV